MFTPLLTWFVFLSRNSIHAVVFNKEGVIQDSLKETFPEVDLQSLPDLLVAFVSRHSVSGGVTLILPTDCLSSGARWVPRLPGSQAQVMTFAAAQTLGGDLEKKAWTKQLMDTDELDDCYFFVGAKHSFLKTLCTPLQEAGLSINSIQTVPSLSAWLYAQSALASPQNGLWIHLEDRFIHFFTREKEGELVYRRQELRNRNTEDLQQWVEAVVRELRRFITYFEEARGQGPISQIVLLGPEDSVLEVKDALAQQQEVPVSIAAPLASHNTLPPNTISYDNVLISALLARVSGLPYVSLRKRLPIKNNSFIVKLAACFTAMAFIGLLVWNKGLQEREAQLIQQENKLHQLTVKSQKLVACQGAVDEITAEIEALEQFWGSRFAWSHFLSNLAQQLDKTKDAWVDSLSVLEAGDIYLCGHIFDHSAQGAIAGVYEPMGTKWEVLVSLLKEMEFVEEVNDIQLEIEEPYVLSFRCRLKIMPHEYSSDFQKPLYHS